MVGQRDWFRQQIMLACLCYLHYIFIIFVQFASTQDHSLVNECGKYRSVYGPEKNKRTYGLISTYENNTFNCEWLITTSNLHDWSHLKYIHLRVNASQLDCCLDTLYFFDGASYEDQLLASLTGRSTEIVELIASSGYMLVVQHWHGDRQPSPFTAEYVVSECPRNCSYHGVCLNNQCVCRQHWTGDACQFEYCPRNCTFSGQCVSRSVTTTLQTCTIETDYRCECLTSYIGQACDLIKTDNGAHKQWLQWLQWRSLFNNEQLFSSRASHSSVYDPQSDTIYTYGGRNHENVYGDLLGYSVNSNRWYNFTQCHHSKRLAHPKPLWGHSLNVHNASLLLFGGIFTNGSFSSELWTYNIETNKWTVHNLSSAPALAFHSATIVDSRWLYIYGGRTKDGAHMAHMFRIDLNAYELQCHTVYPLHTKSTHRQLAGHTAVYYKPLRSIIIFGGISPVSALRKSKQLSNAIHLFNVKSRVWSVLLQPAADGTIPSGRAFHSMVLFEHYLLLFGGHCQADSSDLNCYRENCHDNRLYVYSLTCHRWLDIHHLTSTIAATLPHSNFPLDGLISHTMVRRKHLLFMLGGYSTHVRAEVYVFTLPKVLFSAPQHEFCSQFQKESTCNLSQMCMWCLPAFSSVLTLTNGSSGGGYCVHFEQNCSPRVNFDSCPGLCVLLDSCQSCLSYNAIHHGKEDTYAIKPGLQANSCVWDKLRSRCIMHHTYDFSQVKNFVTNISQCSQHDMQSGVSILKYYYPQNFSLPDEVFLSNRINVNVSFSETFSEYIFAKNDQNYSHLKAANNQSIASNLVNIARILGFVHPFGLQPFKENTLRLYLASSSTQASFMVDRIARSLRFSSWPQPLHQAYIDLPVNYSSDSLMQDKLLIDLIVRFPIRPTWTQLEYEQIRLSSSELDKPDSVLSGSYLSPYSNAQECEGSLSCVACLTNQACAWCPTELRCVDRINQTQCTTNVSDHSEQALLNPEQCLLCSDHLECEDCVRSQLCEWLHPNAICVRLGRFIHSIRELVSCPIPCKQRMSCDWCLDPSDHCMWCRSQQKCLPSRSLVVPYDYCHTYSYQLLLNNGVFLNQRFLLTQQLNTSQILCGRCLRYLTCPLCDSDHNCQWCYLHTNPSQGFCALKHSTNSTICNLTTTTHNDLSRQFVTANDSCPLVNECKEGTHNCHSNSLCIDTEQSYKCLCKSGFTGDGITCIRTCQFECQHGYCSDFPDFRCICDLGWSGSDCSVDCGCHYHSSCNTKVGHCDQCENNTYGEYCQFCLDGFYGNATNVTGCKRCQCNGHGDPTRNFCESISGKCYCLHNTEGPHCERCVSDYYGDPRNGGHCYLECQQRGFISLINSGHFGSYIRDVHFGRQNIVENETYLPNIPLYCMWIFTNFDRPNRSQSFDAYYHTMINQNKPTDLISVTISRSYHLNCSLSTLLVYDGIPYFISGSSLTHFTPLLSLCSSSTESQNDINLVAVSGFVTVLYSSENLYQNFNGSFARLPISSDSPTNYTYTEFFSTEKLNVHSLESSVKNFSHWPHNGRTLWSYVNSYMNKNSTWPTLVHSMNYWHDMLIFIGGQGHNVHLVVSLFDLTNNRWHESNPYENLNPSNRQNYAVALFNQTLYLYGGLDRFSNAFLSDFWSCTIVKHSNDEVYCKWQSISIDEEVNIPPLMGHTLTTVFDNLNQKALILVGGFSAEYGFLDRQYIYLIESQKWQVLSTQGVSPIGIFAHSAVYHIETNSLYIFGGIAFQEQQKATPSNTLYILNLTSKVWRRGLVQSKTNRFMPPPRYLHFAVTTKHYMLILGGRASDSKLSHSILAYFYHLNMWIPLGKFPINESKIQQQYSTQLLSATVAQDRWLYTYQTDILLSTSLAVSRSIKVISIPFDLCSLHTDAKACLNMLGCSFCTLSNNNEDNFCFNPHIHSKESCKTDKIEHGLYHFSSHSTECGKYHDCLDCTAHNLEHGSDSTCQWCTDCSNRADKCISLNEACKASNFLNHSSHNAKELCVTTNIVHISMCPSKRCFATDCDKCLKNLPTSFNNKTKAESCVWSKELFKFIPFGRSSNINTFEWICIDMAVVENTLHWNQVETIPPLSCPARCHKHDSCSLCLEAASGDESGSHECLWSELTQQCMSSTFATIGCVDGLCGHLQRRKYYSHCLPRCDAYTKASDCLLSMHCGWCAINGMDGVGICLKGGLMGPSEQNCNDGNISQLLSKLAHDPAKHQFSNFTAKWHYIYLPKENECLNMHHTCDEVSQQCVDLEEGFMCRCKSGYKLIENQCKPICHQGCLHGVCVTPDTCQCNFGFIGHDCSYECNCNGHSTCRSIDRLNECVECQNNTLGVRCDKCKPFFVGDPRNSGSCQSCYEYCHTHSNVCIDEKVFDDSYNNTILPDDNLWNNLTQQMLEGPTTNAVCNCNNNTEGSRCERCKLGYFKINDDIRHGCRKCMCNGHGFLCNPLNGENCNCHNNTENERGCNYLNMKEFSNYINKTYFLKSAQVTTTYSVPCWMSQCNTCKDYFYGNPKKAGHQCYRHMYIDKEYCIDPVSQDDCPHTPWPLLDGRTVFFGIQPRYMNVDIKIVLYLTQGDVDLFLCAKEDMFVVKVNDSNGFHNVYLDKNYLNTSSFASNVFNISTNEEEFSLLSLEQNSLIQHPHLLVSPYYLKMKQLSPIGFMPYYYTLNSLNEIVIFRNVRYRLEVTIPYRMHDLRTTRLYIMLRGNHLSLGNVTLNANLGYILFRQDQCRIDLFIFFSVFFCSFFLFLCLSVISWKIKQMLDNRRAIHIHEIELEHMASRPFAGIRIFFELNRAEQADEQETFHKLPTPSLSVQSTPVKKLSLLRQLTLGFKESPKIYPEGFCGTSLVTRLHQEPIGRQVPSAVSIEPTSDDLAAVYTTLVQLPGSSLSKPSQIAAVSTLVSLKHSPQLAQLFTVSSK